MTKKLVANHIFHHADGVVFLCGAESLQTDIVTVQCSRNRCFMDIILRL